MQTHLVIDVGDQGPPQPSYVADEPRDEVPGGDDDPDDEPDLPDLDDFYADAVEPPL